MITSFIIHRKGPKISPLNGPNNRPLKRRTTVGDYLRRARAAGIIWPLPDGMTESTLEALLFPPHPSPRMKRPEPDWAIIHRELGRKGVTLELLWQEFREQHPDGFQYSAFCQHYRAFAHALPVTLRKSHTPENWFF